MATPRFRAQVTLNRISGLAADQVVNVLHFEGDQTPEMNDRERFDNLAPGLANRLEAFYVAISGRLANTITGTGKIDLYDMRDARPRIPRFSRPMTLGLRGNGSLPSEVALCVSFKATAAPGVVAARRRGRIYIGPFANNQSGNAPVAGDSRPDQSLVDQILTAFKTMATGNSGSARLAIYSPTTDPLRNGQPDDAWNDAVTLWVDDAWDTQRRRGAAATKRTELPV